MKKILFIATGGTIACAETLSGLAPKATADMLLSAVPKLRGLCEITAVQPFNLDSTNMSPEQWVKVAELVQRDYTEYDGFVISHGTDTLSYAAAALSCLIQGSGKPIVLTGSQLPMGEANSDAPQNLYDAFITACSELCGIAVVFCGRIIDGRCARKVHTREFDAFRSIGREDIGSVKEGCVALTQPQNPDVAPVFFNRMCSDVAVIKLLPGMNADIISYAAQINRAIIIEGFGMGGIPDYGGSEFEQQLVRLAMDGVITIMTTQVPEGGCDMSVYEVGRACKDKYRVLEAADITTEMAAMKTMWALAFSYSYEDFCELFRREI